jgi:hypothetical protein
MFDVLVWALLLSYPLFVAVREGIECYWYWVPINRGWSRALRLAAAAFCGITMGFAVFACLMAVLVVIVHLLAG